jgi:hypothetical protein
MFEEGFKTNHVSSGVLSLKRKEFRDLRQTNRTVAEYIEEFNTLSRYAPEDVDTDAKRRERFLDGLIDELSLKLSVVYCPTFQELMDKARILEGKHQQVDRCKRKHNGNYNSGSNQRTRSFHHDHGNSGYHRHGDNGYHQRNGNGYQHRGGNGHHHNGNKGHNYNSRRGNGHNHGGNNGHSHSNDKNRVQKDISQVLCYKCNNKGHYANDCPEKKAKEGFKPNPFQKGHVNHDNVEEVQEEPDAVIGMLLLNKFPAIVLFDTGASHSFISRVFVDRNSIPTESIPSPIKISSPGGELVAAFGCRNLSLDIGAYSFSTSLIVLESQGLDVILGMNWMTEYEGVIDCAKRSVTLTTPEKKRIRFKSTFELRGTKVNSLKGVSLEDVLIVR